MRSNLPTKRLKEFLKGALITALIMLNLTPLSSISPLFSLFTSPFLTPSPVYADYNVLGTPVTYYNFNSKLGSTSIPDKAGNSMLTLQDASINLIGKSGNGLKLDGTDDYASASDSADFSQTSTFSVEAYFKPDTLSSTADTIQTIVAKWDETTDIRSYRLIIQTDSTGRAFPKFQISTDGTSGNIKTVTGTTQIITGKWYQITGYFNASGTGTISIYINGVEEAQTTAVGTSISDESSNFYMGATKTGASTYANYFDGIIDEVRIFSGTRAEGAIPQSTEGGRTPANITFNDGADQGVYYEEKRAKKAHWGALINFPTDDTQWVEGVANTYSLDFDGTDDWVDLGQRDYLQLGTGITISAWINPDNLSATQTLVSQPQTNGYTFYLTTAGELVFGAQGGTTATTTDAGIIADSWQYVTVSYDGTNAYFFKDGRLISSPSLALWSVATGATLIGKNTPGTPNYFNGQIDDLTIFPYSRTAFEVQIDKNAGLTSFGKPQALQKHSKIKDCPTGYVFVPGSDLYSTDDFCVMKYEAKCDTDSDGIGNNPADGTACENDGYGTYSNNSSGCACTSANGNAVVSTAAGFPLTDISQTDSITYCEALGDNYHLITNAEWMTIARNAEAQSSNWCTSVGTYGVYPCGNNPGTGMLASGHVDNSGEAVYGDTSGALEASTNDAYECYRTTTGATVCDATSGKQKRTHTLSNGEIIWDISGNVYDWNSDTVLRKDQPDSETSGTPDIGFGWTDFAAGSLTRILVNNGSGDSMGYDNLRPSNSAWNANQRVGRIYTYSDISDTDTTVCAFRRGGSWGGYTSAGVFGTFLYYTPGNTHGSIGFRCVVGL